MTAPKLRRSARAPRSVARVVLAFPAAAAAFFAATAVPIIVSADLAAPSATAFSLHSLSIDAELLCWAYLCILGVTVAFGLPTWLILHGRRWGGAVAYPLSAAAEAVLCFFVVHAALHLPGRSTLELTAWSAAAGALSGVVFQWIVRGVLDDLRLA